MVSFGIYPKQTPEQIRYLLEHSEAKVVFVDEQAELDALLEAARGLSSLLAIVPFTEALLAHNAGRDPRLTSPKRFEAERLSEQHVRRLIDACDPDATAILIYTSGTTGPPKGAMISHRNVLSLLTHLAEATPFYQNDVSLNFLP